MLVVLLHFMHKWLSLWIIMPGLLRVPRCSPCMPDPYSGVRVLTFPAMPLMVLETEIDLIYLRLLIEGVLEVRSAAQAPTS